MPARVPCALRAGGQADARAHRQEPAHAPLSVAAVQQPGELPPSAPGEASGVCVSCKQSLGSSSHSVSLSFLGATGISIQKCLLSAPSGDTEVTGTESCSLELSAQPRGG